MRADLDRNGVLVAIDAPADAPTTLAMVDLDPDGVPAYHFYLSGTSAAAFGLFSWAATTTPQSRRTTASLRMRRR